jgi:uncharacterized hydrophobic protein (TIGR00271 family)
MKTSHFFLKIINYTSLESERDTHETIHEEIAKGIVFKGTNLWILVFAIIIASVGLNMNSTAVIIGAMLISPLMGPINGMGYSIATYNSTLFRQAFKNFNFAVLASLFASTTYFAISPVSTAHSELLARTSPTIYDVIIALFGGLAGIVAISSKQKGNVIPGVAIATALMPPLCTAGYGLATGQFAFFFGAMYLFTINTVFIAIASVTISQILKFPIEGIIDSTKKKKINRLISGVILIVLLPSLYFGYDLVMKERFNENAKKYISNISLFEGNYLLKSDIDSKSKGILLVYGGLNLSDSQKEIITKKAEDFNLDNTNIVIKQGLAFDTYTDKNLEVLKLREQLSSLDKVINEKQIKIDSISQKGYFGKILLNEIKNIYPQIIGCTFAETFEFRDTSSIPIKSSVVVLNIKKGGLPNREKNKVRNWVETRLKSENVKTIFE